MRIAYIAAGAAGMYCGSCLHDNTLAAALLEAGEDVVLVPTYTPLKTDEPNMSSGRPIFFGGINVYLQQKISIFRHTPWWLDRMWDHPAILGPLTRGAGSVDPARLGDLTISMLQGEDGYQRKELQKLAHWLMTDVRPDVIHLSNALMMGMAPTFARQFGPPVVCTLSGEDTFLDRLVPPYRDQARQLMRQRAKDVHAFTALNGYFADAMADYLAVERNRVHVIPHGLRFNGYGTRSARDVAGAPQVIGFLARVCQDKGLHLLVEACEMLAREKSVPPFELRVAGYLGPAERKYLLDLQRGIAAGPLAGKFQYCGELDLAGKQAFLKALDVFSLPTVRPEAKGLSALEALASGVPVVLPAHGSFVELVADTGGGVTCEPCNSADLARKLSELVCDPQRATQLGLTGQAVIRDRYHARLMADRTRELYRGLIADQIA